MHSKSRSLWVLKWTASTLILIGIAFRSAEGDYKSYDLIVTFFGVLGWSVVSIVWKDRAMIMLNAVSLFVLGVGILNNV